MNDTQRKIWNYLTVPNHPERLQALEDLVQLNIFGSFYARNGASFQRRVDAYLNENRRGFCADGIQRFRDEIWPPPPPKHEYDFHIRAVTTRELSDSQQWEFGAGLVRVAETFQKLYGVEDAKVVATRALDTGNVGFSIEVAPGQQLTTQDERNELRRTLTLAIEALRSMPVASVNVGTRARRRRDDAIEALSKTLHRLRA